MSSPYREGAPIPVEEIERDDTAKPLATFDVSGKHGDAGANGHSGAPGSHSGQHGSPGGNAGPAQPGYSAGRIALELATSESDRQVTLKGESVLPSGDKREIRDLVLIDEAGFIQLGAIGGNGGKGGDGGRGGDGARGHDGADATRWSDGSDGGDGGDGGRGGNATSGAYGGDGGAIVVTVADADTPLLMLLRHDIRGGTGGAAGRNGSGGSGGSGGDGGDSYSWTTTSTERNSDGSTSTRTHYHSNSGGRDGSSGGSGASGDARVKAGANGEVGSFAIRVVMDREHIETYPSRYDLRLVSFAHDSLNEDAVYEPRELVRVFDLEVENCGGMPTPRKDELALALARGGWVRPEPGDLKCSCGLPPGERYKVPGELRFRIAEHTPTEPGDPLEVEETIMQRAMLPSVVRDFEHYQEGEAIEQGRFVIRYPVRCSPITSLKSLAAGEATKIRFEITNQSRFALGAKSEGKRVVRVKIATASDSELGDEHVVLLDGARELAPGAGWTHELPLLGAGESSPIEISARIKDGAPEYLRFAAHVTLELGDLDAPASARPVQLRGFDVRVARPFAVSDADVMLVVNHRTTREEIEAWEQLGERLAFKTAIWDLSRERHLDLERPLADGIALAEWFSNKAIVILDNPIEDPSTRTEHGAPAETYPHVYLADDQAVRAAAAGIDIALFGKGMPLQRLLVPPQVAPESAAENAQVSTPIYRRFWLRWWAKPTEDWLVKQARKASASLHEDAPAERHVVVYRFAPELDTKSAWMNKWRVGYLHTIRTLDAAAGAVVHGDVAANELHDPAYVASNHAMNTLLAMFGFEENLERLRVLLGRVNAEGEMASAETLAFVVDALVLDVANELAAIVAPGWMGDDSGDELTETLPRLAALARAQITCAYDSDAGAALRRLAGRVKFLARSQVSWWEAIPPFRWMRRGPAARSRIDDYLDQFVANAFGEHNAEQAEKDVEKVADEIATKHKLDRKINMAPKRRVWALEQARIPIADRSITSDTEVLPSWEERVMSGAEYDALAEERAIETAARERLLAGADKLHAQLFVRAAASRTGS